jgi:hypothetical protein
MRGLKRHKFTRTLEGPSLSNQRVNDFDFATYRSEHNLTTAYMQYNCALIAPAKARSPLRKVKREHTILQAAVEKGKTQITLLQSKSHHSKNTIIHLKACNNQLMQDIYHKRKVSNKIIDEAMSDARKLMAEALVMMREVEIKCSKINAHITAEQNLATTRICAEKNAQFKRI